MGRASKEPLAPVAVHLGGNVVRLPPEMLGGGWSGISSTAGEPQDDERAALDLLLG
ncbi:hypothetical protein MNEG_2427, partial [Monoraphidium neglectum]